MSKSPADIVIINSNYMIVLPNKLQISKAQQKSPWDFGNDILYEMCRDNFKHEQDDIILTKVLFIGRIYAAAVERRKNKKDDINDDFYIHTIAPTFRKSELDNHLEDLKTNKELTINRIQSILHTHFYLTSTLNKITELNKRSFSSKYLHFHLPHLFFIYDSRAVTALREFTSHVPKELKHLLKLKKIDMEYAKFYCKCFDLKQQIESHFNLKLTIRQFDNILIEIANMKNSKK